MDIREYEAAHVVINQAIVDLRELAWDGIGANRAEIAALVRRLGETVTRHVAQEDRELYPALAACADRRVAAMSVAYRKSMSGLARDFTAFVARWSQPEELERAPRAFRAAANDVLKRLHHRVANENRHFYPAIGELVPAAAAAGGG